MDLSYVDYVMLISMHGFDYGNIVSVDIKLG